MSSMKRRMMHCVVVAVAAVALLGKAKGPSRSALMQRVSEATAPPTAESPKNKPVILFNGKDLSGFTTWLVDTKREDPRRVFLVTDGMIRISGDGFGYLATEKHYKDYELVAEFRWGQKNFRGREGKARDSGIFLHAEGPDGNSYDGKGAYKGAVECQVMEGAVGDLLKIRGSWRGEFEFGGITRRFEKFVRPQWTSNVSEKWDNEGYYCWNEEGAVFRDEELAGRLNWKKKDSEWKDVFGFRGKNDVESPSGEWTKVQCICRDNTITVLVNGEVVNQVRELNVKSGQVLLQCEGSEIYFRRMELHPLPKIEEVK
jgi:hypothetical protein